VDYLNREHYSAYVLIRHFPCRSLVELRGAFPSYEQRAVAEGLFGADQADFHFCICRELTERSLGPRPLIQYLAMIVIQREFEIFERLFEEYWRGCLTYSDRYRQANALANIEKQLNKEGCSLHDVASHFTEEMYQLLDDDIMETKKHAFEPFFKTPIVATSLNASQSEVVTAIINGINAGQRGFFINGCAGSGKTFLVIQLILKLRQMGLNVLTSAYSGIAASLIPGAVTAHRLFGLPAEEEQFASTIGDNSFAFKLLSQADTFIIDECSMLHQLLLDAISVLLQRNKKDTRPFGYCIVILVGDFRQGSPIVRGGTLSDIIQASIANSPLFKLFSIHSLNVAVRFDSLNWASFLLDVATGKGEILPEIGHTAIEIPAQFEVPHLANSLSPAAHALHYCATHHDSVWYWNRRALHAHYNERDIVSLKAHYSYEGQRNSRRHFPDVEQGHFANVPHHELELAVGCPVMILRNILVGEGLCNGTIAVVSGLFNGMVQVQINGKQHSLPRINFIIKKGTHITVIRHQFPLQLAYGASISKLQGQTISAPLTVDLTSPCFAHGQLYVALSRPRSPKLLTIITTTTKLRNVVYHAIMPPLS